MEMEEFIDMVRQIRNLEKALGRETLSLTPTQVSAREGSRSLYVIKDLKEGDTFTAENVKSIRPGLGMHTMYYDQIIGKKAARDLSFATPLSFGDVMWEHE